MSLDEPAAIREIKIRELKHSTSRVLARVIGGERVIVTRYGHPIAVILSIEQSIDVFLQSSEEFVRMRLRAREDLDRSR